MNNEELKSRVGGNISRLRRSRGLTQAELAERINYSDKAVSKWERAESLPDVLTLMNLAEQLGTDLNTLVSDGAPEAAPVPAPVPEPAPEQTPPPSPRTSKAAIQKLSSLLVWVVALFLYMIFDAFGINHLWMLAVIAVPANAIVLLSLRSAWRLYNWNRFLISVIMWGTLIAIYLTLWLVGRVNVWRILLMGILGQAAIMLWFKLLRREKEDSHE